MIIIRNNSLSNLFKKSFSTDFISDHEKVYWQRPSSFSSWSMKILNVSRKNALFYHLILSSISFIFLIMQPECDQGRLEDTPLKYIAYVST